MAGCEPPAHCKIGRDSVLSQVVVRFQLLEETDVRQELRDAGYSTGRITQLVTGAKARITEGDVPAPAPVPPPPRSRAIAPPVVFNQVLHEQRGERMDLDGKEGRAALKRELGDPAGDAASSAQVRRRLSSKQPSAAVPIKKEHSAVKKEVAARGIKRELGEQWPALGSAASSSRDNVRKRPAACGAREPAGGPAAPAAWASFDCDGIPMGNTDDLAELDRDGVEDYLVRHGVALRTRGNLLKQRIAGDGNCLFRGFAWQVEGDEENHAAYRRHAVEAAESDDRLRAALAADANWSVRMRTSGEYGDHLAVCGLADAFQVAILVFRKQLPDQPPTCAVPAFYDPEELTFPICLLLDEPAVGAPHYEALQVVAAGAVAACDAWGNNSSKESQLVKAKALREQGKETTEIQKALGIRMQDVIAMKLPPWPEHVYAEKARRMHAEGAARSAGRSSWRGL